MNVPSEVNEMSEGTKGQDRPRKRGAAMTGIEKKVGNAVSVKKEKGTVGGLYC